MDAPADAVREQRTQYDLDAMVTHMLANLRGILRQPPGEAPRAALQLTVISTTLWPGSLARRSVTPIVLARWCNDCSPLRAGARVS